MTGPGEGQRWIPASDACLGAREMELVAECLGSGWVSSIGPYVGRFEEAFASFCGCRYGVATASGTAALHLALLALGVGCGDEVLVPALTFVSTANAVVYTGAKPVFVDSDPTFWNIDPEDARRKVTDRTRAVIPVHLFGNPADLEAVGALAKQHDLALIEDAAEAHGAEFAGRRVGGFGEAGCFSFFGNKLITTGEGGMIVTDREGVAAAARRYGDLCRDPDRAYWHDALGFNYRLGSLAAALGLAQLERIDEFLERKRMIARRYSERIADVPGITLPVEHPKGASAFWMFSVLVGEEYGMSRDELSRVLRTHGVDSRPFFHPLDNLPHFGRSASCPVAEHLARTGISLPSGVTLRDEDVDRVCSVIAAGARRAV